MERSSAVLAEVSRLYETTTTSMGAWMWRHHVGWVAKKAKELAQKYNANAEYTYCAALLHDLGDAQYERGHADFEAWSWNTSKQILKTAGYRKRERDEILEAIRTHSCHPGHLPTTVEGRVLATADGMWHLQTNFFPVICYMNRPESGGYEAWQAWFRVKIERDFNVKLLFEDEKVEAREVYEALMKVFTAT